MRVLIFVYVIMLCGFYVHCGRNKHKKIHIKIHVPKLVKHHHHTKLVVLHKPRPHGHFMKKFPLKAHKHKHFGHLHRLESLRACGDCMPEPVQLKKPEVVHRHHVHHYHHEKPKSPSLAAPKYQKIVQKNYHRHHYGSHNVNRHNADYLNENFPADIVLGYDNEKDRLAHKSLRAERVEVETFGDNPSYSSGYKVKEDVGESEFDSYKPRENYESLEDFGGANYEDDAELIHEYKQASGKYVDTSFEDHSLGGNEGYEGT